MTSETKLRSMVHDERKLIAALDRKVSGSYLRQGLRLASSALDLVEEGCLGKAVMEERRSPAELAWWLGQTEKLLKAAILQRKDVEDIVTKFGPDARSYPS